MQPLPTSVKILTFYAQFLSRSFKSVESIKNYISAIKLLHLLLDFDYPQFDSFHLKLVLKGIARLKPHCPKQAQPVTPVMLRNMHTYFDMTSPVDVTFWCLFLHAFFLMFRKSNLVPDSATSFDINKQLCRKNFTFDEDRNVLLVSINWSKTIQFGERTVVIPLVSIPNSILCPVEAYFRMQALVSVSDDSPAYCCIRHKKVFPITYRQFQSVLKQMVSNIGKNPDEYSTHSFRRGGASWAFSAEVPSELIQLYGDWKSDAYKKYLKFNLDDKIFVANKMSAYILNSLI